MRKLLLIVFVFIHGLLLAQSPQVSFNMDGTYFCPGETIMFSFAYNVSPSNVTNLIVRGPLQENANPIPGVAVNNYGSPYSIPACSVAHSGYYFLSATIGGVVYNNIDNIEIHVQNVSVSASASTDSVLPGGTVTLTGFGADYYYWSPTDYLDAIEGTTVHANIPANIDNEVSCIDFVVTGVVSGDNRVVNGDFELSGSCLAGYGFGSDYDCYSPGYNVLYTGEGGYSIYDDASYVHRDFSNPPNNEGHGNFMIINGDELSQGDSYRIVWTQQIHVRPNVQYAFSADVCSFVDRNYARLQFKINDDLIGNIFTAHPYNDGWQTFYALWEGTPSNTATITLVDLQTAHDGNDFGIDNINFYDLMECSAYDTVTVCIECDLSMGDIAAPAAICDGGTLNVDPPTITPSNSNYACHWEIAPSSSGPWQTLSSFNNISSNYNGWYLRYVVTCHGQDFFSNSVRIVVIPDLDVNINVEGNTETCEGDTVTLHAVVDSLHLYVSPGDILCTDGTIVRPDDWPVAGKVAKGIVFYVDNSGSHGWAVSLTSSSSLKWCTLSTPTLIGTAYSHWRDAIGDMNGAARTQSIKNAGTSSNYPAAWNPNASQGWYLPAIGQLNVLFGELVAVNYGLSKVGATQITDNGGVTEANGNVFLWSSTEKSNSSAYAIEVRDGQIGGLSKSVATSGKQFVVRAIIDF